MEAAFRGKGKKVLDLFTQKAGISIVVQYRVRSLHFFRKGKLAPATLLYFVWIHSPGSQTLFLQVRLTTYADGPIEEFLEFFFEKERNLHHKQRRLLPDFLHPNGSDPWMNKFFQMSQGLGIRKNPTSEFCPVNLSFRVEKVLPESGGDQSDQFRIGGEQLAHEVVGIHRARTGFAEHSQSGGLPASNSTG